MTASSSAQNRGLTPTGRMWSHPYVHWLHSNRKTEPQQTLSPDLLKCEFDYSKIELRLLALDAKRK